ncbi:MAG: hypothetical protein NTZ22_12960 [Hyphomicrobiales bacterium]|jgi:hypothetical protein|nr:hypothetical protein [Hyphomicrobiales bacterium]NBS02892.1 hypothetical protein [Hyphomicrobiales bacterium]
MANEQLQDERIEIQKAANSSKKEIVVLELYMFFILCIVLFFLFVMPSNYIRNILGYENKELTVPGYIPASKN